MFGCQLRRCLLGHSVHIVAATAHSHSIIDATRMYQYQQPWQQLQHRTTTTTLCFHKTTTSRPRQRTTLEDNLNDDNQVEPTLTVIPTEVLCFLKKKILRCLLMMPLCSCSVFEATASAIVAATAHSHPIIMTQQPRQHHLRWSLEQQLF